MAALHKSWDEGKLSARRVVWTPEMDTALIHLCGGIPYAKARDFGPQKIGVSERKFRERYYGLGLNKIAKSHAIPKSCAMPKKEAAARKRVRQTRVGLTEDEMAFMRANA